MPHDSTFSKRTGTRTAVYKKNRALNIFLQCPPCFTFEWCALAPPRGPNRRERVRAVLVSLNLNFILNLCGASKFMCAAVQIPPKPGDPWPPESPATPSHRPTPPTHPAPRTQTRFPPLKRLSTQARVRGGALRCVRGCGRGARDDRPRALTKLEFGWSPSLASMIAQGRARHCRDQRSRRT